jgi:hypothetical protein
MTYSVQQDSDSTLRVKSCLITSELRNFSNEHDDSANEIVEIGGGNARGCELISHRCVWFSLMTE